MPYTILGTRIDCTDKASAIRQIRKKLAAGEQTALFTPNLMMIGKAAKQKQKNILNLGDLNVSDGSGIYLALKAHEIKRAERVAGIDIAHLFLRLAAQKNLKVYLLGGKAGVAKRAADKLSSEINGLSICGTHHGYFDLSPNGKEARAVIKDIKASRADVLIVCLGSPRQEQFIIDVRQKLKNVRLFMALGGSLDVWSGNVRRAPVYAQKLHLEWLWRCAMQPSRIKNVCSLPAYFIRSVFAR